MLVACYHDAERPDGRPLILDVARSTAVRSIVRSPSGGIHPIRSTAAARTTAFARLSVSTRW